MTLMSFGSLSASASAAAPTAVTDPVLSSTAIADGSSSTRPRPSTQTRVLTVPRSIATLPLLNMVGHLKSASGAPAPVRCPPMTQGNWLQGDNFLTTAHPSHYL